MKLAMLADRLRPVVSRLACPKCGTPFALGEYSLVCQSGHCYDLSAKGYVNFAPSRDQSAEKYDAALFHSRRAVFADGFYQHVLDAVKDALLTRHGGAPFTLLDAGCGEGYYARELAAALPHATVLGADLSRDAVLAAAKSSAAPLWFVADLKRLPVKSGSLDAVLDVLTPADYAEFRRALAPEGELYKLIPGADYLREIRSAVRDELQSDAFDNARVIAHLEKHAEVLERVELRRVFPLDAEQSARFLRMTPMTFSVPEEKLSRCQLREITIHMVMLRCKIK